MLVRAGMLLPPAPPFPPAAAELAPEVELELLGSANGALLASFCRCFLSRWTISFIFEKSSYRNMSFLQTFCFFTLLSALSPLSRFYNTWFYWDCFCPPPPPPLTTETATPVVPAAAEFPPSPAPWPVAAPVALDPDAEAATEVLFYERSLSSI